MAGAFSRRYIYEWLREGENWRDGTGCRFSIDPIIALHPHMFLFEYFAFLKTADRLAKIVFYCFLVRRLNVVQGHRSD